MLPGIPSSTPSFLFTTNGTLIPCSNGFSFTLLLPLSGPLAQAGAALRDGFFAAYYQSQTAGHPVPVIQVVDSAQGDDFISLYTQVSQTETDLIIGPLFENTFEVASDYSYNNRVNIINPLSTSSDLIKHNPYAFLFRSTIEVQSRKTAEIAESTTNTRKCSNGR